MRGIVMIRSGSELDALGLDEDTLLGRHLGERVGVDCDPRGLQAVAHDVGHGRAEDRERPSLRCDDRRAEVAHVHALRALSRHQRELVERQRPDRTDGLDERQAVCVALLDVLDDPVVGRVGLSVAECRHALRPVRLHGPSTDRYEECVELHALASPGAGRPARPDPPTRASP